MKQPALFAACFLAAAFAAAEETERVALIGDSMMKLLAHQAGREFVKRPGVEVALQFTSLGSGLARLDAFDWMGKLESIMADLHPHTVIVALGANDRQPMILEGGRIVEPGDPAWETEYARRVGMAMDILLKGGARRVVWLELPDMRDESVQKDADFINRVFRREAESRPNVFFFETRPLLSRKSGGFTKFLMDERGRPFEIRDPDGIHLSRAGADLVAAYLMRFLWPTP